MSDPNGEHGPDRELSKAWVKAAERLQIRIEAPYVLSSGDETYGFVAHLPDFGGPKGLVIESMRHPKYERNKSAANSAKEKGLYWSAVNRDTYITEDLDVYKEALADWGWYGDESRRPNWLAQNL